MNLGPWQWAMFVVSVGLVLGVASLITSLIMDNLQHKGRGWSPKNDETLAWTLGAFALLVFIVVALVLTNNDRLDRLELGHVAHEARAQLHDDDRIDVIVNLDVEKKTISYLAPNGDRCRGRVLKAADFWFLRNQSLSCFRIGEVP